MKQSLNTHDIYVLTNELAQWVGFRVLNIYDIDSKTICIKFNSLESKKKYLIIESGTKIYQLDNFTALKDIPGSFCSKLRKHLDNKRLESIKQINIDRVLDLQFGIGEFSFHIVGEFYGSGNIIFTDHQYKILTLIHPWTYTVKEEPDSKQDSKQDLEPEQMTESKVKVSPGHIYPFDLATTQLDLTSSTIKEMFEQNILKLDKKIKLKQFVSKLPIIKFSPSVLEHCFKSLSIDINKKISPDTKFIGDIFDGIDQVSLFINLIYQMFQPNNFVGLITLTNIYPFKYAHLDLTNGIVKEYPSFIEALSVFFQETKPIETKEVVKKKEAQVKLSKQEKAIWNIQQQVKQIDLVIDSLTNQINIISEHIVRLDEVFRQMDVALFVPNMFELFTGEFEFVDLNRHNNIIKFKIIDMIYELDSSKSIWENRDLLYSKVKKFQKKKSNVLELLEKQSIQLKKSNWIKNKVDSKKPELPNELEQPNKPAQPNNAEQESKKNSKQEIKGQSKPNWFEQFNWFITSDNLLFISGKTADQNELVVKRYMGDTDLYIHSEVFGSGSGVIKNPLKKDIPGTCPKSLIEAGTFLIAHTKAWASGVPNPAYWVNPSQVSKTPESGEYLTKGSFIIRGQKNFIQVDKMELGFGILFKVGKKTIANANISEKSNPDNLEELEGFEGFEGTPNYNTQIEYAIPIISAYSALSQYKFKVKVLPGTQKIKKILPEVLSSFTKKANSCEKEAIKKIPNDSFQRVLITGVKFVLSK